MDRTNYTFNRFDEFISRLMNDADEYTYHHDGFIKRTPKRKRAGYNIIGQYVNKCRKLPGNHSEKQFVAFFEYKYANDDMWSLACQPVLVDNNANRLWFNEWDDGQDCFRNIHIVPLRYVMNYYQDYVLHM